MSTSKRTCSVNLIMTDIVIINLYGIARYNHRIEERADGLYLVDVESGSAFDRFEDLNEIEEYIINNDHSYIPCSSRFN